MTPSVDPIWPWPFVVLTSVFLTVLVVTTYRVQLNAFPQSLARVLLGLRLTSVVVLVFAMFRPVLQKTETDETPVQLLVLRDVSRSMNTGDMSAGATRFKTVTDDLAKYEPRWKEFGKQVEVRHFDFGNKLSPTDATLTEGTEDQTAFGHVFEEIVRESRDRRTLALLLLTDGAHRAMPPFDADPLTAARKLGDAQIPLYAIGYGAASLSTAALDLAVEDLVVPEVVFERNRVPVKGKLRAAGAAGKKVQVRVLLEDRTGKALQESGELKPAPASAQATTVREYEIKSDNETIPIELSLVSTVSGELKIGLEVVPLESELLKRNNRRETVITVKAGGLNIAYFDVPRPEQKFLRQVNGADKIQLDYQEVRLGRQAQSQGIDPSWFDPDRYDVFIIGDLPASVFGPELLKKLVARLEDGAGLMMTGGFQNFAAGGYANTSLADWLPVEMNPADEAPKGKINTKAGYSTPIKVVPTEAGLKHYVMQLGPSNENKSLWTSLAPLKGATVLKPLNDRVPVWAETSEGVPLLMASTVGNARVAAFAGDTTYLWCLVSNKHELHQRFWRQMILWLAKKEADTDQPLWVKVNPRNYTPGSMASLTFGARDQTGLPLEDVTFQIEVTSPDGSKTPLTPRRANGEHMAEFPKTQLPGDYWVRVSGSHKGEAIPFSAFTRFIVDERDLELDYPSADHEFLKELAAQTGGVSLKPEDLDGLFSRLKAAKFGILTRVMELRLWDNWWLLGLFVGLMSLEWFLRKKRGLV